MLYPGCSDRNKEVQMITTAGCAPDTSGLIGLAKEAGFTHAAALDMDALEFREDVRAMCRSDRCNNYGKSWSCPPATGSTERAKERISGYHRGIIVQTCGEISGSFDLDGTKRVMLMHKKAFDNFVRQVRSFYPGCLPMGAGACSRCRSCTYPDRPCRHPDRMYPSMEAYGLLVSDVALRSGLGYNYGENTMSFSSCILID